MILFLQLCNNYNDVRLCRLFNFSSFTKQEVHKALKTLNTGKTSGPDLIAPFFLKLAAEFIAEPLTYIFYLTMVNNEIPKIWKSAFILSLVKGGEPLILK